MKKIFAIAVVTFTMLSCNSGDGKTTVDDSTNKEPISSEAQKIMEVDDDSLTDKKDSLDKSIDKTKDSLDKIKASIK